MKLPRDLDGEHLAKLLVKAGYKITRQVGSHMRITCVRDNGEFHITIPKHSPLKVGTLNNILKTIAEQLKISKEEVIKQFLS